VAKPSAWKSKDGKLWFATTRGLAIISPDSKLNQNPPPVRIEEVFADKKQVTSGEWRMARNARDPVTRHPSPVTIPPGRGELEFHYTALSLTAPEKNRFKYQLEGFDLDWMDAGTRRVAYYNNLRPGGYRFHVIACNNDGVWN